MSNQKYTNLDKIISGGQTGADMAGLVFAHKIGIATGGTAPKGYKTESGEMKHLLKDVFGLNEFGDYKQRTIINIEDAGGTVIFVDRTSAGSLLTMKKCRELKKPYLISPSPDTFVKWLTNNKIRILNVAGNRESVSPGIEGRTIKFLQLTIGNDNGNN